MIDDTNEVDDLNQMRKDLFAVGTLGALNYVINGLSEMPDGSRSFFSRTVCRFSIRQNRRAVRVFWIHSMLLDLANRASVVINTMDARGLATFGLTAVDNTWNMSPAGC